MPLASHGSIAESEKRIREMRRASSSGLGDEKPWVKAQASKEKAEIAALQQTVEFLSAEAQASREWRAEGRAAIDGLRTDVAGVLDKDKNLLTDLDPAAIEVLQQDGTISGGMIPKLETCVKAVESGVDAAVILDGRVPHAMLLEIFTDRGAGTLIRK